MLFLLLLLFSSFLLFFPPSLSLSHTRKTPILSLSLSLTRKTPILSLSLSLSLSRVKHQFSLSLSFFSPAFLPFLFHIIDLVAVTQQQRYSYCVCSLVWCLSVGSQPRHVKPALTQFIGHYLDHPPPPPDLPPSPPPPPPDPPTPPPSPPSFYALFLLRPSSLPSSVLVG